MATTVDIGYMETGLDTSEATTAPDDPVPSCGAEGRGPTVWYSFTPTGTTFIGANTFGSDYDTTLMAYVEDNGALVEIACSDDAGNGVQSRVRFDAEAGVTYLFMVGAFASGAGGNLSFNLIEAPPLVQIDLILDPVGSVRPKTGVATLRGTLTCTGATGVWVDGSLRQRVGRSFIDGYGSMFVECDGEVSWTMEVVAWNGLFTGGRADANVSAYAFEDDSFDFESSRVRLKGSRK